MRGPELLEVGRGEPGLQNEAPGPARLNPSCRGRDAVRRDQYHGQLGIRPCQRSGQLEPITVRQPDVDQGRVWA